MTTSSNTPDLADIKKMIATAKVAIITRGEFVFYATILAKLKIVLDERVGTASTDGIHLTFAPTFVASLDHKQRVFLLMHELKHVIYKHVDRRSDRNPKMWNVACDYVINNYLDHKGFSVIPNALLDHKYDGMTADQVYLQLMDQKKNDPSFDPQPDHDDLGTPNSQNGGTGSKQDIQTVNEYVNQAIGEAMVQVQMKERSGIKASGNVPAEVALYWEELTRPVINWRTALARFLFGVAKSDYSWRKPSRRGMSMDIYLPSLYGEGMDCIDFAIDTSGSVSEEVFNKFIAEIHEIFATFNPENIGITQFDTEIKDTRRVCSLDEFKEIQFKGGGGTDVRPALEQFKDSEGRALVILTDGYFGHSINDDPEKPVIWAIYDNPKFVPAFGEAIHFNLED